MYKTSNNKQRLLGPVFMFVITLALGGCAGTAGEADGGSDNSGFVYGASKEEVDSVIRDLEPVTLVFQAGATSPDSVLAEPAIAFQEAIEERSGGKIKLDVIYGQAIAGFDEVDDALADGRVDISFTNPLYEPSHYANLNTISSVSGALPTSPFVGELVSSAAMTEVAWGDDGVLSEYEDRGLTPLNPAYTAFGYYAICTDPLTSLDDWSGSQVRMGGAAQEVVAKALGSSPVSLEYGETYEALQRNTVDCTFVTLSGTTESGFYEAAPHISYPATGSVPRIFFGVVAGSKYETLPLAYQQIIFDATADLQTAAFSASIGSNVEAIEKSVGNGGSVQAFGDDATEAVAEANRELAKAAPDGLERELLESVEHWTTIAEEFDFEDSGEMESFGDWYEADNYDYQAFAQRIFEEAALDHRP